MLTDIQIAQSCQKKHILEIAKKIKVDEKYIDNTVIIKLKSIIDCLKT